MIGVFTVVSGPDAGKEFRLTEDRNHWIGRGKDCFVKLTDLTTSRRHGRVLKQKDKFLFTDGDSKNGTRVNADKCEKSIFLKDGDRLTLGKSILELRIVEA